MFLEGRVLFDNVVRVVVLRKVNQLLTLFHFFAALRTTRPTAITTPTTIFVVRTTELN